ncbi:MAG: hypothetical protein JW822_00500 [Spirochaetales bacterium]|nr:hypothetical protein [Spirochaetales bacterium]
MKKTNCFLIFLLIIFGCVILFSLAADRAVAGISFYNESVALTVTFTSSGKQAVLEALNDGLKSHITFSIKIYERSEGLFAFLGDRLVAEYNPSSVAYKDFFDDEYVIESWRGEKTGFKSFEQFFKTFLTLNDFILQGIEESEVSGYYMLVRVQLDSVKLIPPFTILSFLPFKGRFLSPWVRMELSPSTYHQ